MTHAEYLELIRANRNERVGACPVCMMKNIALYQHDDVVLCWRCWRMVRYTMEKLK